MAAPSFELRRTDARRTQSFFREINDHVAELSHEREASPPRFLCECLRIQCGATIVLSLEEYARVRSEQTCFIVLAGHEDAATQQVVARRGVCLFVRNRTSTTSRRPRARTRPIESRMSR
jgi:hypothetical protein